MKRFILVFVFFVSSTSWAGPIALETASLTHVTFDDIPSTAYSNVAGDLVMRVDKSASFLLRPFEAVTEVRHVAFQWKGRGDVRSKSPEDERSKAGDDARFRLGLILSGEAPLVPFFAPGWIKAVRDNMKLPSRELLYLVVDAKSEPGTTWTSPYSDSVRCLSLASSPTPDGWMQVDHTFESPYQVVGLWLMADGDDTGSVFETRLRGLVID